MYRRILDLSKTRVHFRNRDVFTSFVWSRYFYSKYGARIYEIKMEYRFCRYYIVNILHVYARSASFLLQFDFSKSGSHAFSNYFASIKMCWEKIITKKKKITEITNVKLLNLF